MMDERATEAGKRAVETFTVANKDPGLGHFYVSLAKSGLRIFGSAALIVLGIIYSEPLLVFGASMFLVAEIFGVIEEIV